jgi:hypothetical protein
MIGRGLELVLCHTSCVVNALVEDRLGSCSCGLMRNQIEVKDGVSLNFDNIRVNNCPIPRVKVVLTAIHKHSLVNVAVNQTVEYLGLVFWREVLEQVSDDHHFVLLDLSSHCGTTHAISVNDDLLRETISIFLIIIHCIINETLKYVGSLKCCEQLLDFSA